MTQGDKVLVWGASGGLGSFAVQYVLNGGGTPIGVVSSPEKVALLHELGVEAVIDRRAANYRFWKPTSTPRTSPSGAASARTSGTWWARSPTSSSSTRAARPWARRSSPASGAGSS
jgi:NAD(P)-dependent dehydrogenase (short-subunit alcohol dehydrogenase family)